MFTWVELKDMGLRQRAYWLRQAGAVKRQFIADIGYGVRIGMADSDGYREAMDGLELSAIKDDSKKQLKENAWSLMCMFGGGKGV